MTRYGVIMQGVIFEPDDTAVKHLASLLVRLEKVFPPFAILQRLLARIIPMADPNSKPGGSVPGDLMQYLYGWHTMNPGDEQRPALYEAIYHYDPKVPEIPFFPKQPMGGDEYVTERHTMSPEEYHARTNGGNPNGTA